MPRHFVSAGWPYLYDVPGLHNCVPMLFADVCARFFRWKGDEVFFLCGADEHGARTEYVAEGYGTTPRQLLDAKFDATVPLLEKLSLSFDAFERTGDPFHRTFVTNLFEHLGERGLLTAGTQRVAWCTRCRRHLPDRFLEGSCPHCGSRTYGNQCTNKKHCARLVEADAVDGARCAVCAGVVEWRDESHLFFDLERFDSEVRRCAGAFDAEAVRERIARTLAENPRVCVTRDTAWGIPVPGLPGKTVYSWVDSLLAKVSMTLKRGLETEEAYWRDDRTRRHFFLGMDGTPFYGALLPALLLAAGRDYSISNWRLVPNEVFIYEGGVCSKSTGTGIWLDEALATLPADFWRFYIFHVHASVESGAERDVDFRWERFCGTVNRWLLDGLARVTEADGAGPDGAREAADVSDLMEAGRIGEAFQSLLEALTLQPSRAKTARLAPLLGCFLPETGARLAAGIRPFAMPPLYDRELQMRYQDRVDARRAQRGVAEEITDARADVLCVCPIHLGER